MERMSGEKGGLRLKNLNKRLKVAIGRGKSKNSYDRVEETSIENSGGKGKKVRNVGFDGRSNSEPYGKRKRVYADENVDEGMSKYLKSLKRDTLSKRGRRVKSGNGPPRTIWVSSGSKGSSSGTSLRSKKVMPMTVQNGMKFKDKRSFKNNEGNYLDREGVDSRKKNTKGVSNVTRGVNQNKNQSNSGNVVDVDTEVPVEKQRRNKRIRLDPYDISNKRLDGGVSNNESKKESKTEPEKDSEMSMNAQFRAIKPSPSILSFVEDNLLGRRRSIELKRAGYNIDLSAPLDNIPFSKSSERETIEENVFRNKLEFFAAAKVSSSFPSPDLPEIAFAGRSNVGKSSLLNSLTRQWGVARTSDKPGLTQTINFFKLGSKFCLVDLPGYGFAYAKDDVKDAWEELVKEYVATRVGLRQVCLLIDTKWGMKPRDYELVSLMERSQTKYQIVLTKTDLVFPIDVARRAMQIEEALKANKSIVQPVMMASSKSGAGIRSLRTVLSKMARFVKV